MTHLNATSTPGQSAASPRIALRRRIRGGAALVLGVGIFVLCISLESSAIAQTLPTTTATVQIIEQSASPVVGTEGRIDVVVPYEDLVPAQATNRADVVLRVVDRRQWGTGWRYDIRYIAATPGEFDLVRALRREGEDAAPTMSPILVKATGVLPDKHDGTLVDVTVGSVRAWRWYWPLAIGVALVWIALLWPLIFWGRRRAQPSEPQVAPVPSVAERLRPLVLAAAEGRLDADGQGRLERLLVHVWRQRLSLADLPPSEALAQMRDHREAGPLLVAIENWLHRPPGRHSVDANQINRLLEPYASLPADEAMGEPRDAALAAGGAR